MAFGIEHQFLAPLNIMSRNYFTIFLENGSIISKSVENIKHLL